jgi:DNA-directed RNA polymerase specialized sigma24 family protein
MEHAEPDGVDTSRGERPQPAEGSRRRRVCARAERCGQYWYPLYAYTRRRGYDAEDARDLTQAFFAKLLEKRDLRAADPARGRFRTFLLSSMKKFLAGEWRKEHAVKRGGETQVLSLDFDSAAETYGLEPASELSPEAIYERRGPRGWVVGSGRRRPRTEGRRAGHARPTRTALRRAGPGLRSRSLRCVAGRLLGGAMTEDRNPQLEQMADAIWPEESKIVAG